jgi:hypothetical protein
MFLSYAFAQAQTDIEDDVFFANEGAQRSRILASMSRIDDDGKDFCGKGRSCNTNQKGKQPHHTMRKMCAHVAFISQAKIT